jgi:hypothetical protein
VAEKVKGLAGTPTLPTNREEPGTRESKPAGKGWATRPSVTNHVEGHNELPWCLHV